MGRPWADHESWELVSEASEVVGRDVAHLLLDADADELKDTRNAQITTFVSSLMVLDAVERLGVSPDVLAGHSLGEYTALAASGALGFQKGSLSFRPCRRNARCRQRAAPAQWRLCWVSTMTRLKWPATLPTDVWVANFNAPGQVVIAGSPSGVEAGGIHAKSLGAKKVMPLQVSGAFHTPFMSAARDRLRDAIAIAAGIRDSEIAVMSNVDSQPHTSARNGQALLSAQLSSPVRWKHGLQSMADMGVTAFAELGPGGVLTGMAKRTSTAPHHLGCDPERTRQIARMAWRRACCRCPQSRRRAPLRP
jgi:[acyl-carrier-protein] S-malonyltransferase